MLKSLLIAGVIACAASAASAASLLYQDTFTIDGTRTGPPLPGETVGYRLTTSISQGFNGFLCGDPGVLGCALNAPVNSVVGSYTIDASNDTQFAAYAANAVDPSSDQWTFGLQGLTSGSAVSGTRFVPLAPGTALTSVVIEVTSFEDVFTPIGNGSIGIDTFEIVANLKVFGEGPGGSTPVPDDPAPVPLPAGAVLLLTGLAGLGVSRKTRAV